MLNNSLRFLTEVRPETDDFYLVSPPEFININFSRQPPSSNISIIVRQPIYLSWNVNLFDLAWHQSAMLDNINFNYGFNGLDGRSNKTNRFISDVFNKTYLKKIKIRIRHQSPLSAWLTGKLKECVIQYMNKNLIQSQGFLNYTVVDRIKLDFYDLTILKLQKRSGIFYCSRCDLKNG